MNPKGTKTIGVALELKFHTMFEDIIKRTNESKVDFFKRIITSEYKKVINREELNNSSSGDISKELEDIKKLINEVIPIVKETSETTLSLKTGMNKIYCSVLFVLKELFRSSHYFKNVFSNTSLLKNEQLTIIDTSTDKETINSFSASYKIINEFQPKEIVEYLRNK